MWHSWWLSKSLSLYICIDKAHINLIGEKKYLRHNRWGSHWRDTAGGEVTEDGEGDAQVGEGGSDVGDEEATVEAALGRGTAGARRKGRLLSDGGGEEGHLGEVDDSGSADGDGGGRLGATVADDWGRTTGGGRLGATAADDRGRRQPEWWSTTQAAGMRSGAARDLVRRCVRDFSSIWTKSMAR
jgi:hypothetical protein